MMVGYWELTHGQIFESFVSGRSLKLSEPDSVDGPGCALCGKHWMAVRNEPCEPQSEEEKP
jgi:hypothetical protein